MEWTVFLYKIFLEIKCWIAKLNYAFLLEDGMRFVEEISKSSIAFS